MTPDQAILAVLKEHGPIFPHQILRMFKLHGFQSLSRNWRGFIGNHLKKLEGENLVERHQMGWKIK